MASFQTESGATYEEEIAEILARAAVQWACFEDASKMVFAKGQQTYQQSDRRKIFLTAEENQTSTARAVINQTRTVFSHLLW